LLEFHADLSRYKEMRLHCIPYKTPTFFAAILRPFGPRHPSFNTFDLHTPTKFYPDLLRFAGVIPENPICSDYKRWRGGAKDKVFGLAISRSWVQILLEATLRNNLRQVVYTSVPLLPSSITWYRPKGGDALRLGR